MRYKIVSVVNVDGTTLARDDSSHRMHMAGNGGWESLNRVQKNAVCRVVWSVVSGEFEIEEKRHGDSGPSSVYQHFIG